MRILLVTHGEDRDKIDLLLEEIHSLENPLHKVIILRTLPEDSSKIYNRDRIEEASKYLSSRFREAYGDSVEITIYDDLKPDNFEKSLLNLFRLTYDDLEMDDADKARLDIYTYLAGGTTPLQMAILTYSMFDPRIKKIRVYNRQKNHFIDIPRVVGMDGGRRDVLEKMVIILREMEELGGKVNFRSRFFLQRLPWIHQQSGKIGRNIRNRLLTLELIGRTGGRGEVYFITTFGMIYRRVWEIRLNMESHLNYT